MIVVYYTLTFLCNLLCRFSVKRYSSNADNFFNLLLYSGLTGIFAIIFFLFSSGFQLSFNGRTCVYAFVYSLIVMVSLSFSLVILRYIGISESGIITSTGTLILTSLTGFLFFREAVTLASVLRIILMLLATFSIFLSGKKKQSSQTKISVTGLLLCLGSILVGVGNSLINKLFATDPLVTDSNSFFFLTNLFLVAIILLVILVTSKGSLVQCIRELKGMSGGHYLMILLNTVSSNISSLLSILILAQVSVSLHAPLSSAIGILTNGILALWVFQEKPKFLPILLSLFAVILGAFQ